MPMDWVINGDTSDQELVDFELSGPEGTLQVTTTIDDLYRLAGELLDFCHAYDNGERYKLCETCASVLEVDEADELDEVHNHGAISVLGSFSLPPTTLSDHSDEMNAEPAPWQANLQVGHFCVIWSGEVVVYAQILETPADYIPPIRPPYVWARRYSTVAPTGQTGALHPATVAGPITRAQFERALELGWPSAPDDFAAIVADDPRWHP
jgi:hypothetical protein